MTIPRSTFHEQIAENRMRSLLLVLVVAATLAALGFAIGYGTTGEAGVAALAVAGSVAIALLLSGASYLRGDGLVLAASRAREVTERDAPRLVNVVRELSLAADIPMPRVHLIDDTAANAFATGRSPDHASIAITTGLLEKLDREELQGVIGHELSHVRNHDIRFALLVGVLVGSIALLADFFLRFVSTGWSRDDDSGGGRVRILAFALAVVLALVAPLFARFVQLAVSRQREYLADASSVEITRNPYGLERALAKIAADKEVLEVANRATQHLYIVNPIKKFERRASGLLSTHPPILDRINRLRSLAGRPPLEGLPAEALAALE